MIMRAMVAKATLMITSRNAIISKNVAVDKFFEVIERSGKNLMVRCKLCLPKQKTLSTAVNSTTNLKKHVQVCTVCTSCLVGYTALAYLFIFNNDCINIIQVFAEIRSLISTFCKESVKF